MKRRSIQLLAGAAFIAAAGITAFGSSHREAPGITGRPKLDGTDFYAFRSYEPGRDGFVTLIANYIPLQDVYGGPNFFAMDPAAVYEIHVDNNGDAREDLTFQFRFKTRYRNLTVPAGGVDVAVPLINIGAIGPNPGDTGNLNTLETYEVSLIRGDRRTGTRTTIRHAATNAKTFMKPADRIGDKSIANYAQYADSHIYDVKIPGCSNGRLFVGQRREGFVVNLAEAFDLINLNPLGPVDGNENVLADKNVTSLAVEVPIACLTSGSDPVIGAWTTASERMSGEDDPEEWRQVSRLGHPLVNELVIGLKDKNKFNASEPRQDARFGTYVTNPDAAGADRDALRRACSSHAAQRPRVGVPHRRPRPEPARRRAVVGDAPAQHVDCGKGAGRAEPVRRARRRHGRLPQRPPARRRRGGHRAARGGRRAAARPSRGRGAAHRWRALERDHRLHAGRRRHRRRRLQPVPRHVPLPPDAAVWFARPDAPLTGA